MPSCFHLCARHPSKPSSRHKCPLTSGTQCTPWPNSFSIPYHSAGEASTWQHACLFPVSQSCHTQSLEHSGIFSKKLVITLINSSRTCLSRYFEHFTLQSFQISSGLQKSIAHASRGQASSLLPIFWNSKLKEFSCNKSYWRQDRAASCLFGDQLLPEPPRSCQPVPSSFCSCSTAAFHQACALCLGGPRVPAGVVQGVSGLPSAEAQTGGIATLCWCRKTGEAATQEPPRVREAQDFRLKTKHPSPDS